MVPPADKGDLKTSAVAASRAMAFGRQLSEDGARKAVRTTFRRIREEPGEGGKREGPRLSEGQRFFGGSGFLPTVDKRRAPDVRSSFFPVWAFALISARTCSP